MSRVRLFAQLSVAVVHLYLQVAVIADQRRHEDCLRGVEKID